MDHENGGACCAGEPPVTLGRDLFNRMRCRPYYFADDLARVFARHEGEAVRVVHAFRGHGGLPSSYTVEIEGHLFNLPALYTA